LGDSTETTFVTAVTAAAQLGGTERVLLDFANRAFEHDITLRVLTPCDGPLVDLLNKIGVPAEAVTAPERLLRGSQQVGALSSIPGALVGLAKWSRQLRRHPFIREADVIYSVAFKAHVALTLSRTHPVVWHLHEFPPAATGAIWRWLGKRIPDTVLANSHAVAKQWNGGTVAQHHAPRPIHVVHNGVNLDRFLVRKRTGWIHRELGITPDARLIGMPAVFARWKGQFEVIEAFEMIREEFPGVHLVVVGGSIYDTVAEREYAGELERAVRGTRDAGRGGPAGEGHRAPHHAPRAPRIHLLPFQREIELAYPEFDVVVHYSLRPEPFGRVLIEGMACGVPVVAAAEGGPVEILGDGIGARREAGWLVEPRNPESLARILESALGLPSEVLASIGTAGRRRAEDLFSARRFAREVAEVIKKSIVDSR